MTICAGEVDRDHAGAVVHTREREGGVQRLTPIGELDLATVPMLESAFDAVFRDEDAEKIVVDLTELSFMDSTGIQLLLRMKRLRRRRSVAGDQRLTRG